MEGLASLRFELQPDASGSDDLSGSRDAVRDQRQRQDRDPKPNQRRIREDESREGGDYRVHRRERRRADRHDRPHRNAGTEDDLRGRDRDDEAIVLDGGAKPRPEQAAHRDISAECAHYVMRWQVDPSAQEHGARGGCVERDHQDERDQRIVEGERVRDVGGQEKIGGPEDQVGETEKSRNEIEAGQPPVREGTLIAGVGSANVEPARVTHGCARATAAIGFG